MYKEILNKIRKNEDLERTYSEKEALEALSKLLLKKSEEHSDIPIEDLRKNWRKAFGTGLSVLSMIHGAHYMDENRVPKEKTPQEISQDQEQMKQYRQEAKQKGQDIYNKYLKDSKDHKINKFLEAVSLNESSGGLNTKHSRMEGGIHAGDAAVGNYGLMPNTIKEIAGRMGSDHPLNSYTQMDNQKIEQKIANNPDHQKQFATHLANMLHDKFDGDESKMAYSWNQGHNLTDDHFKEGRHSDYQNHDYVQKYQKHRSQVAEAPGSPNTSEASK